MSFFIIPALADTYTDPIGDSTDGADYDIIGGSCTSDGTNLYLSIRVDGTIANTYEYAVGLDIDRSSLSGQNEPVLWNDIGADWAVAYKSGSPELWEWDSGVGWWSVVKSITASISADGKTLTLTVALADIGLSAPFIFDLVFLSCFGVVIPVYDKMPDTGHFTFQYPPPAVGGEETPIILMKNPESLISLMWLLTIIIPLVATIALMKLKKNKQ